VTLRPLVEVFLDDAVLPRDLLLLAEELLERTQRLLLDTDRARPLEPERVLRLEAVRERLAAVFFTERDLVRDDDLFLVTVRHGLATHSDIHRLLLQLQ